MAESELKYSNKPQILRLHELQDNERSKFCSDFFMALNQLLPSSIIRHIKSSELLSRAIAILPDLYYTFVTTNHCRRKLGEQYVYIAMYKKDHYENEGVLLNKKVRCLLTIVELITRHGVRPIFQKKVREGRGVSSFLVKYFGTGQQIIENVQWVVLMVFMLDWAKRLTIIEKILGISYVYTYKNDELKDISYKIQGYLLLAALTVKAIRHIYHIIQKWRQERKGERLEKPKLARQAEKGGEVGKGVLCRICYDEMKQRSATKCGHVFCWACIIKTVEMTEQCPVCRTSCLPREVVQLRNY